jgi:hypothetical protein
MYKLPHWDYILELTQDIASTSHGSEVCFDDINFVEEITAVPLKMTQVNNVAINCY